VGPLLAEVKVPFGKKGGKTDLGGGDTSAKLQDDLELTTRGIAPASSVDGSGDLPSSLQNPAVV